MKKYNLLFIVLLVGELAFGQLGGDRTFSVLGLPTNARSAGLGGIAVAIADKDLTVAADNPALLDSVEVTDFLLQYTPFFGGINHLNASFLANVKNVGPLAFNVSYVNYGEFIETDLLGTPLGAFTPQDYVVSVSRSHRLGAFALGGSLKFIHSSIAGFGASAFAVDIGGFYRHPTVDFVVGVVLKNVGFATSNFADVSPELPTDLQIGFSIKPKHMPARFSLNFSNLIDPNLNFFGSEVGDDESAAAFDQIFRHVNLGLELFLGKAVNLLVGYNHLRNQELRLENAGGGAGFSFGFMVKVKKTQFRFTRAIYHAAGGLSTFSVKGNLSGLKKIF